MTTNMNEIEREIYEYIKEHRPRYKTCVLATSKDNIPRATPVMYHFEGLNIWISTENNNEGKVDNIRINPKVSLAIFDPVESEYGWDDTCGLQLWGNGEIIKHTENEEMFNHAWEMTGSDKALQAFGHESPIDIAKNNLIYIKVTPEKISFVDSKKKRGYKVVWTREK